MRRRWCFHERRRLFFDAGLEKLYECLGCGLVFGLKYLEKFNPAELYDDYYRNETGMSVGRFRFGIEGVIKGFRFFRALKVFTLCGRGGKVLDIGCGRGWTLYFLKKFFGFRRIVGTQISYPAFKFAKDVLNLEVYRKDLLDLKLEKESFDGVTMWHVLEHVKETEKYLKKLNELIKNGGWLVIEVPNLKSWSRELSGKYWLGYDLKYHLTFFSEKTLKEILKKHGFEVKTVRTFSLEYSMYISAQSLLSKLTGTDQLIFKYLQGQPTKSLPIVGHGILLSLLLPVCLVINLGLYFSRRGEILLVMARKVK